MKIAVIGAGYVGLTTAACLAQIGHDVFCGESDSAKLHKLENGMMPFFEPHLEKVVREARRVGRLRIGSTEEAIVWGKAIFICVGTPPLPNGDADLSYIESTARSISKHAEGYRLISKRARCRCRRAISCASTWQCIVVANSTTKLPPIPSF